MTIVGPAPVGKPGDLNQRTPPCKRKSNDESKFRHYFEFLCNTVEDYILRSLVFGRPRREFSPSGDGPRKFLKYSRLQESVHMSHHKFSGQPPVDSSGFWDAPRPSHGVPTYLETSKNPVDPGGPAWDGGRIPSATI
ncbi:hypothetical protein TCAL_17068 [Tigriopus californicus]|uniref:Uncharacterized protein n=1 Tax=Tigriopus californicus TaxID=6832 RepID=A0A553PNK5_TIGCA|nr:hypothetical protein TCAL_17068 [Tigriopus californicus]